MMGVMAHVSCVCGALLPPACMDSIHFSSIGLHAAKLRASGHMVQHLSLLAFSVKGCTPGVRRPDVLDKRAQHYRISRTVRIGLTGLITPRAD